MPLWLRDKGTMDLNAYRTWESAGPVPFNVDDFKYEQVNADDGSTDDASADATSRDANSMESDQQRGAQQSPFEPVHKDPQPQTGRDGRYPVTVTAGQGEREMGGAMEGRTGFNSAAVNADGNHAQHSNSRRGEARAVSRAVSLEPSADDRAKTVKPDVALADKVSIPSGQYFQFAVKYRRGRARGVDSAEEVV